MASRDSNGNIHILPLSSAPDSSSGSVPAQDDVSYVQDLHQCLCLARTPLLPNDIDKDSRCFMPTYDENRKDEQDLSKKASSHNLLRVFVAQLPDLGDELKQWHCPFDLGLGVHLKRSTRRETGPSHGIAPGRLLTARYQEPMCGVCATTAQRTLSLRSVITLLVRMIGNAGFSMAEIQFHHRHLEENWISRDQLGHKKNEEESQNHRPHFGKGHERCLLVRVFGILKRSSSISGLIP
ncbi:hypothetical protein L249_3688 [Ophiocordyceps polyrhachis-furcata BCC 54312]|uniref:Uncharacterized protein n=1 Tax=Ophiocordyceps polyrhachis-furcata BCC 54312 TaxID=1330021 RepID=A0A367L5B3_9HYPO|nr:hypothetical protein L249_3688 [Ophiocordyceps polyrhachis-furcata BCC 54312]